LNLEFNLFPFQDITLPHTFSASLAFLAWMYSQLQAMLTVSYQATEVFNHSTGKFCSHESVKVYEFHHSNMLGLIIIHKGFVSSKMAKLRIRHQSAEVHKLRTPGSDELCGGKKHPGK